MHSTLQDLPSPFSVVMNTTHDTHLQAYHLLEYLPLPSICVTLKHPAKNLKSMLERRGIATEQMQFIDTVSLRATTHYPEEDTHYLWAPDLTQVGKTILEKAAAIPGRKHVIIDAVSTLRHYYSQATINQFMHHLKQRLPEVQANGIFLNENHKPWIPNISFSKVLEL